jgi:hypothetical protein
MAGKKITAVTTKRRAGATRNGTKQKRREEKRREEKTTPQTPSRISMGRGRFVAN